MTTATELVKFQIGETYSTRSACDYECIFSWTVLARSAKFISVVDKHGHESRVGVKNDGNEEFAHMGRYSMAPIISAGRKQA